MVPLNGEFEDWDSQMFVSVGVGGGYFYVFSYLHVSDHSEHFTHSLFFLIDYLCGRGISPDVRGKFRYFIWQPSL